MTTIAKAKPIIFTGHSPPAILDGRKTMTRRTVKWPKNLWFDESGIAEWGGLEVDTRSVEPSDILANIKCPYGKPGDRLHVKEACTIEDVSKAGDRRPLHHFRAKVTYAADGCVRFADVHMEHWRVAYEKPAKRSPIFMPRWASRILLEITEVRVERLGCMSTEDAIAEGVSSPEEFIEIWKSIHGTWEPQIWVWVLQFRRL